MTIDEKISELEGDIAALRRAQTLMNGSAKHVGVEVKVKAKPAASGVRKGDRVPYGDNVRRVMTAAKKWVTRADLQRAGVAKNVLSVMLTTLVRDGRLVRRGDAGAYEYKAK